MPAQLTALRPAQHTASYDGTAPFPDNGEPPPAAVGRLRAGVTAAFVLVPFAGLAAAVWLAWDHGLSLADVLLAVGCYLVTGLGVTVGFHRLLTHRSFTASRPLRLALAVAGSMSFQGDVIGWVAIHRRHHAFTDRPGDPHSPYRYGTSLGGQLRGLAHAHAGWLLGPGRALIFARDRSSARDGELDGLTRGRILLEEGLHIGVFRNAFEACARPRRKGHALGQKHSYVVSGQTLLHFEG